MTARTVLALAALIATLATNAAAASPAAAGSDPRLAVSSVERVAGRVRIVVRWQGERPRVLRLVPLCTRSAGDLTIATTVRVAGRRRAVLEARDDFGWLRDPRLPCAARGLAVQSVDDGAVVATAPVPLALPDAYAFVVPPPPPTAESWPSRLSVAGVKYKAPQTRMTEARVSWALGAHLSVELGYERTAYAPTMSRDHDNGVLTGVKLGF